MNGEGIKSVSVMSKRLRKRLLMPSVVADTLQSFLSQLIHNEVVVVNSRVGIDIYYYSGKNYSQQIVDNVRDCIDASMDMSRLHISYCINRKEVYERFCYVLQSFVHYPQLFLAYIKKLVNVKEKNREGVYVMPILNAFFEENLRLLLTDKTLPHYSKVEALKQKSHLLNSQDQIIRNLVYEILLKKYSN